MKIIILILLSGVPLLGEDWTTTTGKSYHNVDVHSVLSSSLVITSKEGTAIIHLADLSPDLQKRFGYDPARAATEKAKAAEAATAFTKENQRAQTANKLREQMLSEAVVIDGKILDKGADGYLQVECDAPELSHISADDALRGGVSSATLATAQKAQPNVAPQHIYGTFFLYGADPKLLAGDVVRVTAYPNGQHTDSYNETKHAYTTKLP